MRDGPDSVSFERRLERLQEVLWMTSHGMQTNSTTGSKCWVRPCQSKEYYSVIVYDEQAHEHGVPDSGHQELCSRTKLWTAMYGLRV